MRFIKISDSNCYPGQNAAGINRLPIQLHIPMPGELAGSQSHTLPGIHSGGFAVHTVRSFHTSFS